MRTPMALETLRSEALSLSTSARLQHSASQLWPSLAEKDLLLREIGMDNAEYHFDPLPQGGSRILVTSRTLGVLPTRYEELPYEWRPPYYSGGERIYSAGPLQYLSIQWHSKDLEQGCELTLNIKYVPRYSWLPVKAMLIKMQQQILAVHRHSDAHLSAHSRWGSETFFADSDAHHEEIHQLYWAWRALLPDSEVPGKLAEFIYTAPDKLLLRLRPFEVAEYYQLPRMEVLRFCLLATRQGFLDMNWDVLCPSCRGANLHTTQLDQLTKGVHCDGCNIRYDAAFDQNVEVSFRPVARWRKLDDKVHCLMNPGNFKHVWAQINVEAHQTRKVDLYLPAGQYKFTSLSLDDYLDVRSGDLGAASLSLHLDKSLQRDSTAQLAEHIKLSIHNPQEYRQTLKIEHDKRRQYAASAALITSLQDFRDLFGSEVLRPGVQLGIANLSFLFTDLKDSTRLYESHGDASAFALVQTHFDIMQAIIRDHQGGIVKTIGDAVMAVFTQAEQAVTASLAILAAFAAYNREHSDNAPIIVKLGIHSGPCIALNLNDKLDYFGSTINRAARAQGQSAGCDLVLSHEVYQVAGEVLKVAQVESFSADLKGIRGKQTLYRVRLASSLQD